MQRTDARHRCLATRPLEALLPSHVRNLLGTTPPPERVFANRELRMADVKAIGFDYDYTLASYTNELNTFIYDRAKDHLMERSHYPAIDTSYDPNFAIRGLLFDRRTGYLVKLSYARAVAQDAAFLGRRRLAPEELVRAYGPALHCDPQRVADDMSQFNDLFALSEVCLLADVVQLAVDRGIAFDASALAEDVARAISHVHISGALHDAVRGDPATYLHPIEGFGELLASLRSAGKELFVLTNSPVPMLETGMKYLLGDTWRDAFDVVVASARKPKFWRRDQPFRAVSTHGYVKWSRASGRDLEKNRVLLGGSLAELSRLTGWGSEVLYVGDHVHADLREPRRQGWATAAIVRELERELAVVNTDEYKTLHERSMEADQLLTRVQALGDVKGLDALEAERENVRVQMRRSFNENFGSVFRHRADATAYAFALKQHADIYTSRLEHLLACADSTRFYPTRCRLLPHDP
jgi:HAD superfamily 5'-nucleotidase-like hydrolase